MVGKSGPDWRDLPYEQRTGPAVDGFRRDLCWAIDGLLEATDPAGEPPGFPIAMSPAHLWFVYASVSADAFWFSRLETLLNPDGLPLEDERLQECPYPSLDANVLLAWARIIRVYALACLRVADGRTATRGVSRDFRSLGLDVSERSCLGWCRAVFAREQILPGKNPAPTISFNSITQALDHLNYSKGDGSKKLNELQEAGWITWRQVVKGRLRRVELAVLSPRAFKPKPPDPP